MLTKTKGNIKVRGFEECSSQNNSTIYRGEIEISEDKWEICDEYYIGQTRY